MQLLTSTLFFAAALVFSPFSMAASGEFHSSLLLSQSQHMDLESTSYQIVGSVFGQGNSSVNLSSTNQGWQGWFGSRNISSTKVKTNGSDKVEVRISTNSGIYDFTFKTKSNGDVSISSFGPQGENVQGKISKQGTRYSLGTDLYSFEVNNDNGSGFTGNAVAYTGNLNDSGPISIQASADLAPLMLESKDAAEFALLYVLPYMR